MKLNIFNANYYGKGGEILFYGEVLKFPFHSRPWMKLESRLFLFLLKYFKNQFLH